MRKKWFSLGCLTSIVILIVIFFIIGNSISKFAGTRKIKRLNPNTYLELKLSGEVKEYNEIKDDYFKRSLGKTNLSVFEIVQKINFAIHDPNIRGIILEPDYLSMGYASMSEVQTALKRFRESGKKIYAYLEMCGNKSYILATDADEIYLNPSSSAGIILTGVGREVLFYKDVLDKIGVEYTVVHAGQYKGFGETYARNSFSEPVKRNLDRLMDSVYQKMLNMIATNRNIPIADVKKLYETRKELFISQETAINYKLVDKLSFKEDMLKELDIQDNQLLNIDRYVTNKKISTTSNRIAVVYAEGTIAKNSGNNKKNLSAKKLNKILDKLEQDDSVKAVVIRVNSPGGSALESEIMVDKIEKLKAKKPVVISMGDVAASGGYYISSNAEMIVADPFTITGSIGVVAMFPNAEKLSHKIGLHSDDLSRGKYASILNLWKKPNPEILESIETSIDQTYNEFKQRVSTGRNIPIEEVEKYAQGQVWSSDDALNKKLIDKIGNLNTAVISATELAKVSSYDIDYYPKQKSFMQALFKDKFDIDIPDTILDSKYPELREIKEARDMVDNLREEPIQALLPFKIK